MLKSYEKSFAFFQKSLDGICVGLCWILAYHIRFNFWPGAQDGLTLYFLKFTPILVLTTIFYFHKFNLYKSQRFSSKLQEITTIFYANSSAILSFIVILYFFAEARLSRLTIISYFIISIFSLTFLRILVRNYLRSLRRKGKNLRHILLIGSGPQLGQYIEAVLKFKDSGIRIKGIIDGEDLSDKYQLNKINEPVSVAKKNLKPDALVIGYKAKESFKIDDIVRENYDDLMPVQVLPDLTYSFIGHKIEDFAGIPLLSLNRPKLDTFGSFLKRTFDIMGSLIGLIIISPLLIIISVAIKLTSKGPIFYGQERMGLDGGAFTMWKFRTMKVAKEGEDKTTWTTKDDPRKTKLGNFLRKTSLDEFPQLFNVLVGDMSLVGPRPERPYFVDKFKTEIPGYMLRHKMKSGITGWAQINGWRGDTSIPKRIECDNYYIKNWSFWLDIKILILTFWKGFINKNAY